MNRIEAIKLVKEYYRNNKRQLLNEALETLIPELKPKYKIGDWIVCCDYEPFQIIGIRNDMYKMSNGDFRPFHMIDNNHNIRLWTIEDAKDGDVLATLDYILIFKKLLPEDGGISYCHYDFGAGNPQFIWFEDKNWYFGKEAIIHPATKKQCNFLFQKMKEAGYEWNAEKKELKEIKQQSSQWNVSDYKTWQYIVSDVLTKYDGIGQYLDDGFCKEIARYMQEEWSKKLSLKQKIAWSEDDEKNASYICAALDCYFRLREERNNTNGQEDLNKARNWLYNKLKYLKPQNTWKPSDEQMNALDSTLQYNKVSHDSFEYLNSLFNDLNKLKDKVI